MSPLAVIRDAYSNGAFTDTFDGDLQAHLAHGFVISTPECFLAWRRVGLAWTLDKLRDPWQVDPEGREAWIWAGAGRLDIAARLAFDLSGWADWIGWDRRGCPRLISADALKRKLHCQSEQIPV